MSKSRAPKGAVRRRSAGGDDDLFEVKRGGFALVVDDLAEERVAAASGAARAAGARDLAARVRASAHAFAHGLFGNAFALADEHSRASSRWLDHTVLKMKFKIIFVPGCPAGA